MYGTRGMKIYLGVGSNLGNRKRFLKQAWYELKNIFSNARVSSTYESDALLPVGASESWNKPFLNVVIEADTALPPPELLIAVKKIEAQIGRKPTERWAPREIDIDILMIEDLEIKSDKLKVPHPEIANRPFALLPLLELNPSLSIMPTWKDEIPFRTQKIDWRLDKTQIMGILNITPDSFSDGGELKNIETILQRADFMISQGATVLDLGAESTRPGAVPIDSREEMGRLGESIRELTKREVEISVDTRHAETATWAIEMGAHWINDVSGFADPEMITVAKFTKADFVFMHNLGIPADPKKVLSSNHDPVDVIRIWAQEKIEELGISKSRLIFDPGIGFGKTAEQSVEILKRISEFRNLGVRLMVGHSRKSFLKLFTNAEPKDRDAETLTISRFLASEGVEYLRVHDVVLHAIL